MQKSCSLFFLLLYVLTTSLTPHPSHASLRSLLFSVAYHLPAYCPQEEVLEELFWHIYEPYMKSSPCSPAHTILIKKMLPLLKQELEVSTLPAQMKQDIEICISIIEEDTEATRQPFSDTKRGLYDQYHSQQAQQKAIRYKLHHERSKERSHLSAQKEKEKHHAFTHFHNRKKQHEKEHHVAHHKQTHEQQHEQRKRFDETEHQKQNQKLRELLEK